MIPRHTPGVGLDCNIYNPYHCIITASGWHEVELLPCMGCTSRISRVQTRRIQMPNPIGAPKEMTVRPSAEKSAKIHHLCVCLHRQTCHAWHSSRRRKSGRQF
jgi:hypothetical protein